MGVKTVTKISQQMAQDTCKIGEGRECCRYLFAGPKGLECGKLEPEMKNWVDAKVLRGDMVSLGDHCDGVQMLDL